MALYERMFAGKGQRVGEIVELHPDEAGPLVRYGRLKPVEAEPKVPEVPKARTAAGKAATKGDAGDAAD